MKIVNPLFPKTSKRNISFEKFRKEVQRFTTMISRLSGGYCMMSEPQTYGEKYSAIAIGNGLFVVVIEEVISTNEFNEAAEVKEKAYCITKAKNWREAIENIKK